MAEQTTIGDQKIQQPILTPEQLAQQQKEMQEAVSKVETSIKITEKDKEKFDKKAKSEQEEIDSLQNDLSTFLQDKIAIVNDDGGIIEKFPTGIDILDAVAGGGFGVGTFTMIVGNPGTFKSALLGSVIAAGQKKYNGKMLAVYHDSESAMSTERLAKLAKEAQAVKEATKVGKLAKSSAPTLEKISNWLECQPRWLVEDDKENINLHTIDEELCKSIFEQMEPMFIDNCETHEDFTFLVDAFIKIKFCNFLL